MECLDLSLLIGRGREERSDKNDAVQFQLTIGFRNWLEGWMSQTPLPTAYKIEQIMDGEKLSISLSCIFTIVLVTLESFGHQSNPACFKPCS